MRIGHSAYLAAEGAVSSRWRKVGILAGGGALPVVLAEACAGAERAFLMVPLRGHADEETYRFGGKPCGLAEMGKIVRSLREAECDAVVMAGLVARPNFATLKPDWRGAALLPRVVGAARRGDGALLDVLVEAFEAEGFLVLGAEEVARELAAPAGLIAGPMPSETARADIAKAAGLIAALGPFDVGQGAIVRNGHVLAVEAAEGTDEMISRVASLRIGEGAGGVLVKRPKPSQERRVDLPTIGVRTVEGCAAARLSGIAIEAEGALVLDRASVARAAEDAGLFVYAFGPAELRR